MNKIKYSVVSISLWICFSASGQGISIETLRGYWQSQDSTMSVVQFTDSGYSCTLWQASGNPYFFTIDSTNMVSASGYFPNWPPLDCNLKLLSSGLLEITYSVVGSPNLKSTFRKIKK